jgi:hypothetical protein
MCYAHGIIDGEWIDKRAKEVQNVLRHEKHMSSDDFLRFLLLPSIIDAWTEEIHIDIKGGLSFLALMSSP